MAYIDSKNNYPRPSPLTASGYMTNPSLSPFALSPTLTATSLSALSSDIAEDSSDAATAFSPLSDAYRSIKLGAIDFDMVELGRSGVPAQVQTQQTPTMGMPQQEVDFDQYFNFDGFDSGNESHSPATASPTRTPPSFKQSLDNVGIAADTSMDMGAFNGSLFDNDFGYLAGKDNALAGPSTYQAQVQPADVVVKQEPVEFGWDTFDMGLQQPMTAQAPVQAVSPKAVMGNNINFNPTPAIVQSQQASMTQPSAGGDVLASFGSLPFEQQVALQQMLLNIMSFQANMGGFDATKPVTPSTQTIDPSKIFAPGLMAAPAPVAPAPAEAPVAAFPPIPNVSAPPPMPQVQKATPANAVAGPSRSTTTPSSNDHAIDEDDELVSIGEAEMSTGRGRSMSTFSSASGLDEKLDRLAPLNSIFSAGRGKGGKKGGGMSSVVRGEDEDLDDDDSWRPSAEEYKKLNSKEKRQLRNKLSARAFRNRRKDYIGTLEGHIKERDVVIDEMRSELQTSKSENQDLRRELEALKKSTMSIIHPATAVQAHPSQVPSVISALTMPLPGRPASGSTTPLSPAPRKLNTAPTPQFNPRKDLPANGRGRGAGGEGIFGGPPTICHTILTPEMPFGAAAVQRQNMNPRLSAPSPRGSIGSSPTSTTSGSSPYSSPSISTSYSSGSVYSHASTSAHLSHNALNLQQPTPGDDIAHNTFDQWMDANPFSIRMVDSYRRQMWSRLAREAQADKAGLVGDMRPKFYTEAHTTTSDAAAAAAGLATAHITSKLAQSFIGAFTNTHSADGKGMGMSKMDGDKLTAVVTGRAHLKVVSASAKSPVASTKTIEVSEKDNQEEREREMDLVAALGGLRLQSGPGLHGPSGFGGAGGLGARSDPLGFIGGFLGRAAHPTRA